MARLDQHLPALDRPHVTVRADARNLRGRQRRKHVVGRSGGERRRRIRVGQRELALVSARRLEALLAPLHAEIRAGFPEVELDADEQLGRTMTRMHAYMGSPTIVGDHDRATLIRGVGYNPVNLLLARWTYNAQSPRCAAGSTARQ